MNNMCRVRGCRFPVSHTTAGHLCGTCRQFGHGQLECGSDSRINVLKSHWNDKVDDPCTVANCPSRDTHKTVAHHCANCKQRGEDGCICNPVYTLECPKCRTSGRVDIGKTVATDAECIICYERGEMVIFPQCRHAVVCQTCTRRLQGL